jgi:hypothetical protein
MQILIESACWNDAEASASSDASASCYGFAEDVLVFAIVETKLELGKIQRQIFLTDMVIVANDSAL